MNIRVFYPVSTKPQSIEGDVPIGSATVSLKWQN
jgi:hypothetical protein